MADTDVPTTGSSEPPVPPPPLDSELTSHAGQLYVSKLTANQVVVWLALTVVIIALSLVMSAIETKGIKDLPHGSILVVLPWWKRVVFWAYRPSFAACLVASGVLIRCKCLRMLGKLQPGHWIVLILATAGILACITRPFYSLAMAGYLPPGWTKPGLDAIGRLQVTVVGAMFTFAAIRLHDARHWMVLLVSGAVNSLFWAIPLVPFSGRMMSVWQWAVPWWFAAVAVIALVVVALDWPHRARRDWPHWLGASLWTLGNVATLFTNLHVYTR